MHAPTTLIPHEEIVSVLKKKIFFAYYIYGNGLVEFGVVWGFNANRSNSRASLPRAIGSPTGSRTINTKLPPFTKLTDNSLSQIICTEQEIEKKKQLKFSTLTKQVVIMV